ncbi:MAG: hypothetical protein LV479_10115 [Methylacidiphilales bacterium]|nr:hypothetical protein [Candidatus Methylacidiphilales bacterium]
MTTDKFTSTRDTLIKDMDNLKRDAGQIVEDVKEHASTHVKATKDKANEAFDFACNCAKEHPLKLAAAAFFIGFITGTFRRK